MEMATKKHRNMYVPRESIARKYSVNDLKNDDLVRNNVCQSYKKKRAKVATISEASENPHEAQTM